MSNPNLLPTFMKISDEWRAQAKVEKVLGSFVGSNICRDTEGSIRIPEAFLSEFGSKMPYHLQLRCDSIMWHCTFEQGRKKVCGLYDFFRYYDLRMYSVVMFDYIGKGIFEVKGYRSNAIEAGRQEIDVVEFWRRFEPSQLRLDEFVYGRNHLEIERYISISTMAGTNQSSEMWKIEIEGVSNIAEDAYLELKPELQKLYNGWEGIHHIYLCPGMKFWEIWVVVVDGVCRLGHGWYKFVQDFGIADGDLLILTTTNEDSVVNVCIHKKDDLAAEKKEEERNDKKSFYKVVVESILERGYLVLPPLLGEETEKNLLAVRKLKLYNMEWDVGYNNQKRMIYGLGKLVQHYGLRKFDVLFLSFDKDGELAGRIFRLDGMEASISESRVIGDCFLAEERNPNGSLDFVHEPIKDVIRQTPLPNNASNIPDLVDIDSDPEVEVVDPAQQEEQVVDMEIEDGEEEEEEQAPAMQFSKNLNPSNMNGRCHGMHIPTEVRFHNRPWKHGDDVTFITANGTWSLGLVINNGKPRFSRGWSRFVKDSRLVQNQLVRFTLRQDVEHPVFDVDFP